MAHKHPIVFLHAFPLNSGMWADQVRLVEPTHKVFAPNLPGFGSTAKPELARAFEHQVDFILNYLKQMAAGPSIWCGLSMGGYLALRMIEKAPELCSALVLCDTKAGADGNEAKLKRAANIDALAKDRDAFLKTQWEAGFGESNKYDEKLIARYKEIVARSTDEGIASALVAMATRTDTTEGLPKIKVPTLILVGAEDKVTPLADAQAMNKAIPRSRLHVIPKAGHLSNLENPAEFNSRLSEFLKSL